MENNMNQELTTNKLIGIMSRLASEHGFLAGVIMNLEVHACREYQGRPVATAATNGSVLLFSSDFASNLTIDEIKGVCLHEVWHVAGGHPWRGIGYDDAKVNIAQDHEVNNICLEAGATLPKDRVCDTKYKDWCFERIYEDLYGTEEPPDQGDQPEEQSEPGEPGEQGEQGDDGEPDDQQDVKDEDGDAGEDESSTGEGEGDQEGDASQPNDPSDGDGDPGDGGNASGDGTGTGTKGTGSDDEVEDAPWGEVWDATNEDGTQLTEEQREEALRNLADQIIRGETCQIESGQQDSYGGNATIERSTRPNAPWTKVIREILTRKGAFIGSTYRRPSRRSMILGTASPHRIKSGIPEIVIAVDVSWSIDMVRLRKFFDHLERLREKVRIEKIHVLPFNYNAQADSVVVVKHGEKLPREFEVGGGTRFAPVFDWQRRYAKQAKMVIVFTDMGDNDYGVKPRCPVVWASSDPINSRNRPPFGKAVEIELNRKGY